MTDGFPVDKVAAVADGDGREPCEGRVDHVVVLAHAHNGRVRAEPGQHGVGVQIVPCCADGLGKVGFARRVSRRMGDAVGRAALAVAAQGVPADTLDKIAQQFRASLGRGIVQSCGPVGVSLVQFGKALLNNPAAEIIVPGLHGAQRGGYARIVPRIGCGRVDGQIGFCTLKVIFAYQRKIFSVFIHRRFPHRHSKLTAPKRPCPPARLAVLRANSAGFAPDHVDLAAGKLPSSSVSCPFSS